MNCPVCGGSTGVKGSRRDCEGVYRYRKCKECGHTFFTTELESTGEDYNRITYEIVHKAKRKEV